MRSTPILPVICRRKYSAVWSPFPRRTSFWLIVRVTSRDGQRGLTAVTLSSLRPRLAQPPGLSPDREVPDDHHRNRPRPHPAVQTRRHRQAPRDRRLIAGRARGIGGRCWAGGVPGQVLACVPADAFSFVVRFPGWGSPPVTAGQVMPGGRERARLLRVAWTA
jgi:hypothetical protein